MIKLFKHDFLENYAPIVGANVFLVLCWIITTHNPTTDDQFFWLFLFSNAFLFSGSLALVVLIALAILRSTQQKLFGKQAYLTWSLPLSIDTILLAKIAINVFWVAFSMFCLGLALILPYALSCDNFRDFLDALTSYLGQHGARLSKYALTTLLVFTLLYLEFLLVLSLLHALKPKYAASLLGLVFFILIDLCLLIPSRVFLPWATYGHFDYYVSFFSADMQESLHFLGVECLKIVCLYALVRTLLLKRLELE
ncbi:hypothetical protein ACFOPX_04470 [Helicobacter baculiformis]|uniref:ABC transporter permease n=1 Tax=Helicobacter baculiformis TaxID=427351 RepID=A0ABV7ZGW9_9HELI|nr:hypothetical protein [Helicobacter baculiformis]